MTAPAESQRPNPYVGPRSFRTGEKLFGRDREERELLDLLIAERIVLLHSPSGAGKSSLINAALLPALQAEGFTLPPVIRVGQSIEAVLGGDGENSPGQANADVQRNRHVISAMLSLEEGFSGKDDLPRAELARLSLAEYLDRRGIGSPESNVVLLLDQFEELLTIDPANRLAKQEFFNQLGAALRNRSRWALIAMREDYVASLAPYLRPLPTRLNTTYRLDLLGVEAALQAIRAPADDSGVAFSEEAARRLADDLRRVQVQRPDGTMEEQLGPYIEPVQLQVVCYRLWQNLKPGQTEITDADLSGVGDVNQSLAEYYAERVGEAARQESGDTGSGGSRAVERRIRDWFEHRLITDAGVRGQVLMGKEESDGLDNGVVRRLENSHLVRAEKRRGATWFELAHDRLIEPVRRSNAAWYDANLSLVERQAALWNRQERPKDLLLRDEALDEAEAWAKSLPSGAPEPDSVEAIFLEACRERRRLEEEDRRRREQEVKLAEQARLANRLRTLFIIASAAAVVALIFAALAGVFGTQARSQANSNSTLAAEAVAARSTSDVNAELARFARATSDVNALAAQAAQSTSDANAATAQAAQSTALSDRATANAARLTADSARSTADVAAATAQGQAVRAGAAAEQATSRRLAAESSKILLEKKDLAALLGVEALRAADTWEARSALLNSLQIGLQQNIERIGPPLSGDGQEVNGVALSLDGRYLAYGNSVGTVYIYDLQNRSAQSFKDHENRVTGLAFSRDGKLLVSGSVGGTIAIRNLETGQARQIGGINQVYCMALSPDGTRLAAGSASQILLYDITPAEPKLITRMNHTDYVFALAFAPDGTRLASASKDRTVRIWDMNGFASLTRLTLRASMLAVAWSPDGQWLAAGGEDFKISLWDSQFNPAGELTPAPGYFVNGLSFSSDSRILASASDNRAAYFFDMTTRERVGVVEGFFTRGVVSVAFSPQPGSLAVASSSRDSRVGLHVLRPQQPLGSLWFKGLAGVPVSLADANNRLLAVSFDPFNWLRGEESSAALFSLAPNDNGRVEASPLDFPGPFSQYASAALRPDGLSLALGDALSSFVAVLGLPNGDTQGQADFVSPGNVLARPLALALDPGGTRIAATLCGFEKEGSARCAEKLNFIQVSSLQGELIAQWEAHNDYIRALAFSPGGRLLASGSNDGAIYLWNLDGAGPNSPPQRDGEPLYNLPPALLADPCLGAPLICSGVTCTCGSNNRLSPVEALAFSPDGRLLAAAYADNSLVLYDMDKRQMIGVPLVGVAETVASLAFSPDSQVIYAGTVLQKIYAWQVGAQAWQALACQNAGRSLSQNEWAQYFPGAEYRATCP